MTGNLRVIGDYRPIAAVHDAIADQVEPGEADVPEATIEAG